MKKIKYTEEDKKFLKEVQEECFYIASLDRDPDLRKYLDYKDVIVAAYSHDIPDNNSFDLRLVNKDLLDDRDVALAAVGHDGTSIRFVNPKFYNDDEVVKTAILNNPDVIGDEKVPVSIKKDKKFIMDLLDVKYRSYGSSEHYVSLYHFDDSLRDDKEIVMKTIKHDIRNYEDASDRLKEDKEIVDYVLCMHGNNLKECNKQ